MGALRCCHCCSPKNYVVVHALRVVSAPVAQDDRHHEPVCICSFAASICLRPN